MSESSEAYKDGVAVGMARQFNNLRDANLLKGEAAPDVQQLKDAIAVIATQFDQLGPGSCGGEHLKSFYSLVIKLRQLSAV